MTIKTTRSTQLRSILLSAAAALLAACSSHGGTTDQAPAQGAEAAVDFPDPSKAYVREGTFVNIDNLRLFAPGLNKEQLYALLGTPHFSEGMWGVNEWNYLFNFRSNPGSEFFTCQFKVTFDRSGAAQAGYWKPQACSSIVNPPQAAAAPAPAPAQPLKQPLRLSADALFAFGSADLTGEGRGSVESLLQQVRDASQLQDIQVVGYTDRIGSDSYNLELSHRRALTVRQALINGGVPAAAIVAEGRGKSNPLVQCTQRQTRELITCLAPNRRVEIAGVALRR